MSFAFNGMNPNPNYGLNQLNRRQNLLQKLIEALTKVVDALKKGLEDIQHAVDKLIHGSGGTASNEKVEAAVRWCINKATNNYITYSQTNRNLKNVNGMSYDCSSFIITGFYAAGVNINATYTGNMRAGFTAAGWEWIPGRSFAASQLQRGDILLNEAIHTQMYIGNNQDVNCGSTPARVQPHASDNYGRGWNGILRYKG